MEYTGNTVCIVLQQWQHPSYYILMHFILLPLSIQGQVIELSLSHQQLNKRMQQIKSVRQRYTARLQWLLSDSRLVFGCIQEKKVCIHLYML